MRSLRATAPAWDPTSGVEQPLGTSQRTIVTSQAKQAMDQGRTPVIIDNTNTQAWEMKPYVEMALGKGYRVEFHEPDTWWKFDPAELEKRNKHGVPREKIAQMLERYEYQMSISVVMNSVEPPHKNMQRPPPQRRQRGTDIKKKPGHRLSKAKQKKKRKRNRKMKHDHVKITQKKSDRAPCHLIADDQETSESEEEDSEEESRTSVFTFNGDVGDLVKGCDDYSNGDTNESLKSTKHQTESLPITVSLTTVALASPMKSDLLAEDGGPFLINMTSAPNKNLIKHTLDNQVGDHNQNKNLMENESNSVDTNVDVSVVKTECNGIENSGVMLNNQNELTADQITCEPVLENKLLNVSNRKKETLALQHDFKTSENCVVVTDSTIEQIHESNEELEKEPNLQTLNEESGSVTHGGLQSLLIDKGHNISFIESGVTVSNCLTEVNVPNNVDTSVPSKKKGRCKRIFNLAPNFHIPRQIAVSTKEKRKDVLLMDNHLSENVFETEQERISNNDNRKKNEQNLEFQEHWAPCNNGMTDSSLCLSKKAVSSPAQKFPSNFCKVSSTSKEQIITSKQEKIHDKKKGEREQFSSDLANSQPDILCSVKVTSECPTDFNEFESYGENMHKADESESSQSSQIEDNEDPLNTKSNFLGLPLSLGFAFQLVELFGSPGFPLESLLPNDFIVPLDWKTSKKIHLLWKTSVEQKQKKNGLQNGNSLAVAAKTVEDTNKDCQESEESYETLLETKLYQDGVEENSMSYLDNKHLYNISTNLEYHLKRKNSV
ncbi:NEDD4-binding protein 2-like 2 isoform X4 [Pelodiscus sinensis]|uniref:NEDD4-binding protein 2-like 2 isoform X4 n=1 Tax=Pelodiscus sinensis TaxID=13735 RepID=UPI003F6ACE9B